MLKIHLSQRKLRTKKGGSNMDKNAKHKKDIIKQIAEKFETSQKEVCKEIQILINDARNNPDPKVQEYFTKLFGDRTPTPKEFISIVSLEILKNENK